MRPYITKQPARMRSFVSGITEAIAFTRRRPGEAKAILQKYTRVSDPTILQHAYDSDTRYMEPLPARRPKAPGPSENLGVSGRLPNSLLPNSTTIIDEADLDEGLLKQIYPNGIPPAR